MWQLCVSSGLAENQDFLLSYSIYPTRLLNLNDAFPASRSRPPPAAAACTRINVLWRKTDVAADFHVAERGKDYQQ